MAVPHISPSMAMPHITPSMAMPHISPSMAVPHISPSMALPHISPSMAVPHISPSMAVQHIPNSMAVQHIPNSMSMPYISSEEATRVVAQLVPPTAIPHPGVDKRVWSIKQGEMLLDLYESNKEKFKDPSVKKMRIWGDICEAINDTTTGDFTPDQCHQKLRNFKNDFQKVIMLEKKDCRHFERLHKIFLQSAKKPLQNPEALKRKLGQLAGPKAPGSENGASEKRPRVSLPDFRSRKTKNVSNGGHPRFPGPLQVRQFYDASLATARHPMQTSDPALKNRANAKPFKQGGISAAASQYGAVSNPPDRTTFQQQPASNAVYYVANNSTEQPDQKPNIHNIIEYNMQASLEASMQIKPIDYPSTISMVPREAFATSERHMNATNFCEEGGSKRLNVRQSSTSKSDSELPVPINYYSTKTTNPPKTQVQSEKVAKQSHADIHAHTLTEDHIRESSATLLTAKETALYTSQAAPRSLQTGSYSNQSGPNNYQTSSYSNQSRASNYQTSSSSNQSGPISNQTGSYSNQSGPSSNQTGSYSSLTNTTTHVSATKPVNTSLKFIKSLFEQTAENKKRSKSTSDTELADNSCVIMQDKVNILKDNQQSGLRKQSQVIDLTESLTRGEGAEHLAHLAESVDKWRQECKERENAQIIRDQLREKRDEERHQESMRMTNRFVHLFESLVTKIGGIGE